MTNPKAAQTEERLATELNKNLQDELIASGTWYACLAGLLMVLGGAASVAGLTMIALCAFILGLIFLSQYFDAKGHLREVQRRSTKTLVSDFSVLRRPSGEGAVTKTTAS